MNLIYIKICFTFAHKNNNNERHVLFSKNTANHSTTEDKQTMGSHRYGVGYSVLVGRVVTCR